MATALTVVEPTSRPTRYCVFAMSHLLRIVESRSHMSALDSELVAISSGCRGERPRDRTRERRCSYERETLRLRSGRLLERRVASSRCCRLWRCRPARFAIDQVADVEHERGCRARDSMPMRNFVEGISQHRVIGDERAHLVQPFASGFEGLLKLGFGFDLG